MQKNIYGLYDPKTHNFGDICLLDRDEEFSAGCVELLSNPAIPGFVVNDLIGVCYGYVTFDSDVPYPCFTLLDTPRPILSGLSPAVVNARLKHVQESTQEVTQNDEEVEVDC